MPLSVRSKIQDITVNKLMIMNTMRWKPLNIVGEVLIYYNNLGTKTQSHKRFQTIKHENGIMVLQ